MRLRMQRTFNPIEKTRERKLSTISNTMDKLLDLRLEIWLKSPNVSLLLRTEENQRNQQP